MILTDGTGFKFISKRVNPSKCKVSPLNFIIPLRTKVISVLSLIDSHYSNGVCQFSLHPCIALQDLSEIILICYHTPMGVLKDSLLMGKLSFTYKSKRRQEIARVLVLTIYNFNHNFLLVCLLTS